MKKIVCVLLAFLLICPLAVGCHSDPAHSEQMQNPAVFYYRRAEISYGTDDGVIAAQTVDLGAERPNAETMLRRYLEGPTEEGLESPFPKALQVLSVRQENSKVSVQLDQSYDELSGINATVADACMAKTVLQYTGAEKVVLLVCNAKGETINSKTVANSDILLLDDSSDTSSTTVTLYYSDEADRYLIPERRTVPYMPEGELPAFLIEQLIAGPETNGLKKTLPDGTLLLDINVDNGVCAVDFSADFLINRPQTPDEERTVLLSVVNTLTELNSIDQVQFYVEGSRRELFSFLSISGQFVSDKTAVGPVREDLNETDATVYFPTGEKQLLYAMPTRLKTGSETVEESALHFLTSYEPKNGLENPLYQLPLPETVQTEGCCCTVIYPEDTSFGDSYETEMSAIRMLVASLTALSGINSVRFMIGDLPSAFTYVELPERIVPQADWYCDSLQSPAE